MKRILAYSLSLILLITLTACTTQNSNSPNPVDIPDGEMDWVGSMGNNEGVKTESGKTETGVSGEQTGETVSGETGEQTGQTGQTEQTEQTEEQTEEQTGEGEKAPEKVEEPFTEVNETVYATGTVNLRSSYSTQSEKVGGLNKGQSVTRIGVGTGEADGWSKIQLSDGSIVYVSSKYLSTTKPASSGNGGGNGGTSKPATPPSKPSGDTSKPSQPGSSSKPGSSSDQETEALLEEAMKDFNGIGSTIDPNAPKDKDGNLIKQGGV